MPILGILIKALTIRIMILKLINRMNNKPATCSFLSKPKNGVIINSQMKKKQTAKID